MTSHRSASRRLSASGSGSSSFHLTSSGRAWRDRSRRRTCTRSSMPSATHLEYLDASSRNGAGGGDCSDPVGTVGSSGRPPGTRQPGPASQVHDHVLIANAVLMRDARGGWKGADTAFLRDICTRRRRWDGWPQPPSSRDRVRDRSPTRARPDGSEDGR